MSRLKLVISLLFVMFICELYQYEVFRNQSFKSTQLNRSLVIVVILLGLLAGSRIARYLGAIIIGVASGYTLYSLYSDFSVIKLSEYISAGKITSTPLWVIAIFLSAVIGSFVFVILALSKKLTNELAGSSLISGLFIKFFNLSETSKFSRLIELGLMAIIAGLIVWSTFNDLSRIISKWTQ